MADNHENNGGDKLCKDIADKLSSKDDENFDSNFSSDGDRAHLSMVNIVFGQGFRTLVDKVVGQKFRQIILDVEIHGASLSVERIPEHVEVANPRNCVFLGHANQIFRSAEQVNPVWK